MAEELTDDERVAMFGTTALAHEARRKALRIIDAQSAEIERLRSCFAATEVARLAADRAALVAQLEAAQSDAQALRGTLMSLGRDVSRLEHLARERLDFSELVKVRAEAEVTRLKEALAAAEAKDNVQRAVAYLDRAEAAESECAALRASLRKRELEVGREVKNVEILRAEVERLTAHRERLAARHPMAGTELNQYDEPTAPAKCEAWQDIDGVPGRCVKCWCDECQCQPAAPTRTEAEQRVLDAAMVWWETRLTQPLYDALLELARREGKG